MQVIVAMRGVPLRSPKRVRRRVRAAHRPAFSAKADRRRPAEPVGGGQRTRPAGRARHADRRSPEEPLLRERHRVRRRRPAVDDDGRAARRRELRHREEDRHRRDRDRENRALGEGYVDLARKTEEGYGQGENWLLDTGRILSETGFLVVADGYPQTFASHYPMGDAVFYSAGIRSRPTARLLNPAFRFRRGAIACHIHSFSAASLENPHGFWVSPLLEKGRAPCSGTCGSPTSR